MSVHEDLSRLLAGDLEPADAEALRARIDADPEVAALWERLRSLPFDGLLRARPPDLYGRVPSRRWTAWIPWSVAAAAMMYAASVGTESFEQGVVVQVDGVADVVVEGEMTKPMRVAAVAGAVVTVAVIEGTVTVRAGEPRAEAVPAEAPGVPAPVPSPASDIEVENALLRKMVEDLEIELHGTPVPWPADLPESLEPVGFERNLRAAVAACAPEVQIIAVDCGEPPCLAALRGPAGESPFGEGRTWYDDLVNDCVAWTEIYTSGVAWASTPVECPDGATDRLSVLGWSTTLAPEQFAASEQENRSKRFASRVDELRRTWPCPAR